MGSRTTSLVAEFVDCTHLVQGTRRISASPSYPASSLLLVTAASAGRPSMSSGDESGISGGISTSVAEHYQHVQQIDEKIYLGIQIAGGHILLPILVLTILLSRRINRCPIFVNFCISWIFSSVAYSLLVYRGRSSDDQLSLNPSYDSCLIQASLLNGVQALTACTNLALVVNLWLLLRFFSTTGNTSIDFYSGRRRELIYNSVMLGGPFLVFVVWTVMTMVVGSNLAEDQDGQYYPGSNLSVPSVFYCIILQNANFTNSLVPGLNILRSILSFSCLVSLITVIFEVLIARLIIKRRAYFKEALKGNTFHWSASFLRVVLFSIYRIVALSLNVAIIVHPDEVLLVGIARNNLFNGVIDFFQAAIPLVAFLVFATEKDTLSVWCFWRKKTGIRPLDPQEKA